MDIFIQKYLKNVIKIKMQYVTNPLDPLNLPIESLPIKKIETKLDKGMILQEIPDNIEEMEKQSIYQNIYYPIELGLEKSVLSPYTLQQSSEVISALQTILREVFSQVYHTPVEFVSVINRTDTYIFVPYTSLNVPVFINPKYQVSIPIEDFVGYTLLSSSPLTRYLIEKWVEEGDFLFFNSSSGKFIKYFNEIALISLFSDNSLFIIEKVETNLIRLIKEGYFTYSFGIHDLENLEIVRDLLYLYDIKIVNSKDLSTLICQTNVDFKITPQEWIRKNLSLIKSGLFPNFDLVFDFSFFDDYARFYGWNFKDVVLKYAAYLAYARLSDKEPIIRSSITSIHVNSDLSLTVALPSYKLVQIFKEYILEYLNQGINFEKDGTMQGKWNLEVCKDLSEAILKRWIVQQVDPEAFPMVFKSSSSNEILIHRSPLAIKYPSVFNFQNLSQAKESLLKSLREFYASEKVCHDNIEAVTLENIDEMSLEDLLNLIPVEEKNKIYCFSDSTIANLVKKENPLTRRPFSEKTLQTQKYLDLGLRGLFDIGPLFGLFPSVPTKQNLEIETGLIKILGQYVEPDRRDLVGNVFLVEVVFEDKTTTPLFEISLPMIELERISKLREYVEQLWYSGYFLNEWTTAVYKSSKTDDNVPESAGIYNFQRNNIKSFPVLINNPVLLNAANSIYDGNIALEMLANNVQN